MLDLEHYGLIAAANTLGLSSPSMGLFLASVKEQVAKEQAEIKKKQAVDKVRRQYGRSPCPASCLSVSSPLICLSKRAPMSEVTLDCL